MVIGKQGTYDRRAIQHVSTYDDLREGDLAVINIDEEQTQQPFIGTVLRIEEDEVEIQWMRGGYNKPWKKWFDGVGKNIKANTDVIPKRAILLFGFKLTQKLHLPKATATNIKKLYAEVAGEK